MKNNTGVWIAAVIILFWISLLIILLNFPIDFKSPLTYLFVLLQTHLYTGLFITAHDAMHGVVAPQNLQLNTFVGRLCSTLFMFNAYKKLFPKHHEHHKFVATEQDPDYHTGGFFVWYFHFVKQYLTVWQFVGAAITFNVLKIWLPQENLILYWIVPSVLSTLQLFYFGTYLPHQGEHDNKHFSKSQSKNHLWAFVSCYFFGYHYEHHDSPGTPWWLLYKEKEKNLVG
ncbi:MAG: fatty acid desaturase [Verrucomicrobia bacterium]|nr:fatty acid desaturase [Cytophagales bacterium]